MGHYLSRLSYQFLIASGIVVLASFALPVWAANTDFTADSDLTITAVSGDITADLIIFSGSQAETLQYNSGVAQVTSPNASTFKFGSSNTSVLCLKALNADTSVLSQAANTAPGQSYLVVSGSATYRLYPSNLECTTGGGGDSGGSVVSGGGRTLAAREASLDAVNTADLPLLKKVVKFVASLFNKSSSPTTDSKIVTEVPAADTGIKTSVPTETGGAISPSHNDSSQDSDNVLSDSDGVTNIPTTMEGGGEEMNSRLGEILNILRGVIVKFFQSIWTKL